MIKYFSKEDKITLFIIFLISIVLGNAFLRFHFSSDTYVLIDLGYMNYPQNYFLPEGRIVSSLVCYIAGFLHIPYNIYIIGMTILAILFISIAIFIFYKKVVEILGTEDKLHKLLLLLASFVLIFNQCTLEYLLFPESAVMGFALLCIILAAIQTVEEKKYKYLKVFLLLFIATISYQPLILSFPILVLFFYSINIENWKEKKKIIILKELVIYAIFLIIAICIELVVVKFFGNILNHNTNRITIPTSFEILKMEIYLSFDEAIIAFIDFMNFLPIMVLPMVVLSSLILMTIKKNSNNYVIPMIIFVFFAIFTTTVILTMFSTGLSGRTNWHIGILWGISLIFLLSEFNINKRIDKIVALFIIISFLYNSVMLLRNSAWHIVNNVMDINNGYIIKTKIDNYEKETGNTITKVQYIYDKDLDFYHKEIKQIGSLTESALACLWSRNQSLNYYTNKKLEEIESTEPVPPEFLELYYTYNNYDTSCYKLIYFYNDTMYIIIY